MSGRKEKWEEEQVSEWEEGEMNSPLSFHLERSDARNELRRFVHARSSGKEEFDL